MTKPESVIAYFENHDTSENHELCAKCNGACCRHYAGAYGPWQLFDNPEDVTPESIAELLKKEQEYILDCYEGYSEEHEEGWFIRPPHKPKEDEFTLLMQMLGLDHDSHVDRGFGGECVHFVDGKGCKLSYDERPVMCCSLVAESETSCRKAFGKKEAADWWSQYFNIIDEALALLSNHKGGDNND